MKPHHFKLHLLLVWALFLLSLPLSLAQSQNDPKILSSQEENFPFNFEDGRKIQSSVSKPSGNTFLLNTEPITVDFHPYEKNSFLYYSNRESFPIYVKIGLSVAYIDNAQEAIELALKQGQIIKGRYWPEGESEGEGQGISIEAKSVPSSNHTATRINFSCNFVAQKGHKGKYIIEITNLWEFNVQVEVAMGMYGEESSDSFPVRMNQNFEFVSVSFPKSRQRAIDILTVESGKWYLSVYTCGSPVHLVIDSGKKSTGIIEIPNGGSYFHNETIWDQSIEARENRFTSVTVAIPEGVTFKGKVEIYSAVLDEPEFVKYELSQEPGEINVTYKPIQCPDRTEITLIFDPLKFKEFKPTDQVEYQVEIVDFAQGVTCEEGLLRCSDQAMFSTWALIDKREPMIMQILDFPDIYIHNYYFRIRGFVLRKSHKIQHFIYPIGYKNEPTFTNIGKATVGIVSLVFFVATVILSFQGLKRVREWRARPREYEAFEYDRESPGFHENEEGSPSDV